MILKFPNEEGPRNITSRSALIRSCYEVWSSETNMSELHANFKTQMYNHVQPFLKSSFRFRVESYNKTLAAAKKVELIEVYAYFFDVYTYQLIYYIVKIIFYNRMCNFFCSHSTTCQWKEM